ncbi:MAG: hypothetical protein KIT31_00045 [Deltaproteobacteria bacterium]|nr:hypothetical protein [Deltaproteobacteria bacterium]
MRALVLTSAVPLIVPLVAACASDEVFTIITVDGRPAVTNISSLAITLSNEGSMRTNTVAFGDHTFPVTFSVSAPGRAGDLGIRVDAADGSAFLVARGEVTTAVGSAEASIMLEPADFVVNTDFVDDQSLSTYSASNGFQLSATASGTWTAVYNMPCVGVVCDMFARRFDSRGRPVSTQAAAGTNNFKLNSSPTSFFTQAAVASAGMATVGIWNFDDTTMPKKGIACRSLDAQGAMNASQAEVAVDEFPDLVSVTHMSNGNFAVAWDGRITAADQVRSAIVRPDCTTQTSATVSTVAGSIGPRRSAVASSGDRIMYAWILDGNVRMRVATNANAFATPDTLLIPKTATEQIEYVRVASIQGGGFAVAVRWVQSTGFTGPGRLELYRTDTTGALTGGPTLVSDRSGTDFGSRESFGITTRGDGAIMVVWSSCNELGDGSGCGVFGRVFRPTGVPVGDAFNLATTTDNDQTGPSVVGLDGAFAAAWSDRSSAEPDRSGSAVRARILYPVFDDASRVLGARCTTSGDCAAGLSCGKGSDNVSRCFASCINGGPPPVCPGGGTCSPVGEIGISACMF